VYTTGYGLTECTGGVIHQIDEEEEAHGCVGKLFAGVYVLLHDPPLIPVQTRGSWASSPNRCLKLIHYKQRGPPRRPKHKERRCCRAGRRVVGSRSGGDDVRLLADYSAIDRYTINGTAC
jgi:hypothetical protein